MFTQYIRNVKVFTHIFARGFAVLDLKQPKRLLVASSVEDFLPSRKREKIRQSVAGSH